ncbi:glutathione S-transferase-like isoform X2 [Rhineura floridana]|nr:glutathione S-transferase-like isoform X2 [Rhineura floridana]XP_061478933.1 glutathione S-transferase-like isoform X2 [Rhineura floridana]XP_061478934.1 glutathione S-transferase-like isoform X2 [Rhineura floridana]XP_061478935.1 glutathione S-transferase-like isoform X2 [Rhineura floridana]XP_061478937.1 glutathione S-transferase-like isoform X2 [Rhineura floridana]XP_061478940.1 glutathione S-transferase-like isoform X2 [Rhineura floridana]
MAGKPKLYYTQERGRMESIYWLLAAAGVEFEERFVETREDLEKLRNDGFLLFQQVPMVEIDGVKMVQSRAILHYIAEKHNLYGKDLKERALYLLTFRIYCRLVTCVESQPLIEGLQDQNKQHPHN